MLLEYNLELFGRVFLLANASKNICICSHEAIVRGIAQDLQTTLPVIPSRHL